MFGICMDISLHLNSSNFGDIFTILDEFCNISFVEVEKLSGVLGSAHVSK